MTKSLLLSMVLLSFMMTSATPSVAARTQKNQGTLQKIFAVPEGLVGAVVGVGVGVPVHIAKGIQTDTPKMVNSMNKDMGGKQNGATKFVSTVVGAPLGIASGTIKGSVEGTGRGLDYGYRAPLSPKSTGLRKITWLTTELIYLTACSTLKCKHRHKYRT